MLVGYLLIDDARLVGNQTVVCWELVVLGGSRVDRSASTNLLVAELHGVKGKDTGSPKRLVAMNHR